MAGLFDGFIDAANPPAQTINPLYLGLLGAAAGAGQYAGASRLPITNGQVIGGAGGGFAQGYGLGQAVVGQAQKNQLLGEQLGFYKNLYPALERYLNGQGAPGSQTQQPTVPLAFKNGGQPIPGAPPQAAPAGPNMAGLGNVMNTMGGWLGNSAMVEAGGNLMKYNPALQGAIASAKSDVQIDIQNLNAARDAGQTDLAAAWGVKLMKDSGRLNVARNSGVTTLIGPNGFPEYTQNPTRGTQVVNGVESPLAGAVSTSQALAYGQGAGTQAGKTAYSPVKTEIPSGPGAGTEVTTLGRNVFPGLGGPVNGYGAPSVGGRQSSATPSPQSAVTANGVVTQIAPSGEELSKAAGEQAGKNNDAFQTEAELAKDQNAQIDAIRNAAATVVPGKFANLQGEWLNLMNSVGMIDKADLQKLGSYQEGTKIAIQLQAAATRVLGAREAAQIFTWMGKSMPNLTMSPTGLEKVSSFMRGMNDYKIARAQMAQTRFNQTDAVGVNNMRNDFISKSNPMFFIMADSSPADRAEYLKNMGATKAKQFLMSWQTAERAGFAPGPEAK